MHGNEEGKPKSSKQIFDKFRGLNCENVQTEKTLSTRHLLRDKSICLNKMPRMDSKITKSQKNFQFLSFLIQFVCNVREFSWVKGFKKVKASYDYNFLMEKLQCFAWKTFRNLIFIALQAK